MLAKLNPNEMSGQKTDAQRQYGYLFVLVHSVSTIPVKTFIFDKRHESYQCYSYKVHKIQYLQLATFVF